jgi:hypothetical protein
MLAEAFGIKAVLAPVMALVLVAVGVLLVRGRGRPAWPWVIGLAGVLGFLLRTGVILASGWVPGYDIDVFWTAGSLIWQGRDPYAESGAFHLPFLYPPNVLPVFAALAAVPFPAALVLWVAFNALLSVALVPLARQALAAEGVEELPPAGATVLLSAAVAFSSAVSLGLEVGQLAVVTAAGVFAALWARARGRPVLAGVCLALAAVKAATVLPFLLLFYRRRDLPAWAALAATTLGLCLVTESPGALPARIAGLPARIAECGAPGQVNDYSYANDNSESIVGIDHALFRAGLRDRGVIRLLQTAFLLTVGGWLAWRIAWRRDLPAGAAGALVACYSVLFLYHRVYDLVILALPLTYVAGRALAAPPGRSRWLLVGAAAALLVALYPSGRLFRTLLPLSQDWGFAGQLAQAVVLPSVTWALLAAMLCIGLTARRRQIADGGLQIAD